jgi:fermentation-respiration switch protein FrsA (DUF1100 family)
VVFALAILVALVVAGPAGLWYVRLHPARVPLDDDPARHGLAYRQVSFASPLDDTRLSGWYLPSPHPTGRAVVVAHGIDSNRLQAGITLRLAPALVAAGFDVLAFDLRGAGESGGGTVTFGASEQWDVLGAVEQARALGAERVGVLGFSLGAASALLAAARSPAIDAVVADSAFANAGDALSHELQRYYRLPAPLASYALLHYRLVSGTDPFDVAPEEVIAGIAPRPVLLISGSDDETVPPSNSERLLAAAGSPATVQRWLVPGGGHTTSYLAAPAEYQRRIVDFFREALGGA